MQLRAGRRHAIFEPGYVEPRWFRAFSFFARRSRAARDFFFSLPPSRLRSHVLARYFHQILQSMVARQYARYLPQVTEDATLELFDLGAYRGHESWKQAIGDWLDAFPESTFETTRFIDVGDGRVMVIVQVAGAQAGLAAIHSTGRPS